MSMAKSRITIVAALQQKAGMTAIDNPPADTWIAWLFTPPACASNLGFNPPKPRRPCCMQKEKTQLAMLHVRGAAVRFVHVPGRLDPNAAIVMHRRRVSEAAKAARRQHDAGQNGSRMCWD